ncbi:unannotated protein [freshwater metagenome]
MINQHDSFPLSPYPMFSNRRTTTELVDTAVFITESGSVFRLNPEIIAGTDEVILAAQTVSRSIANGTTAQLCAEITGRFDADTDGHIEIVTEVFDALNWYADDKSPISRTVHATCQDKS